MIIEENYCVGCETCIGCSRRYPVKFHVCDKCKNDGSLYWGDISHLYKYKDGEYCYSCVHTLVRNDLSGDADVDIDNIIDDLEEVDNDDCCD